MLIKTNPFLFECMSTEKFSIFRSQRRMKNELNGNLTVDRQYIDETRLSGNKIQNKDGKKQQNEQ